MIGEEVEKACGGEVEMVSVGGDRKRNKRASFSAIPRLLSTSVSFKVISNSDLEDG